MDLVDKLNKIEELLTEINDISAEIEKNPSRYEASLIKIKNKALKAIRKNNRKFGFLVIVLAERRKILL
ncbi:MAG: hypothetical protein LBQ60_04900 [Bacteroidales bacterium]|jgi:hypothetical protein|nr:hypothetical protein [Bacteroidales bacterium]